MRHGLLLVALVFIVSCATSPEQKVTAGVPQFKVDPYWPKPLPGNLLRSWGGKGVGHDWPVQEHGIFVANGENSHLLTAEVGTGRRAQKFVRQ